MQTNLRQLFVATLVLAAAPYSGAAIVNPSFESPGGSGSFPQADDWGGQATTALHASFGPGAFTDAGASFAFNNPGQPDATQTLVDTFAADTTYTFKSYSTSSGTNNDIQFLIGYDSGGGFIQLAEATYDLNAFTTSWELLDGVTYSTGSVGSELGEQIIVRISGVNTGSGNSSAVWFDNVSLTSVPVPEPGSLALLGLGGLLVFRRQRG